MENKGLLFIPDISGFTRFVNQMEIEHSRLIIQELLEILVNANHIGLEISEIEGDAILFYKFGDSPDLEALYQQVKEMFCEFHKNLLAYDSRRFCQCRGCATAIDLTLKVITHYGEFTNYQVKDFKKLIGKDIIVAHQLLKNDIDQHEYWLITKNLVQNTASVDLEKWLHWNDSVKQTENGEILFHYTQLGMLKDKMEPEPLPPFNASGKVKTLSVSREYETGIIPLFHATGDFSYRSRWFEGIKKVEELNHFLPRVGMRCRCILEEGEDIIYTSSYSYHTDRIEFGETHEITNNLTHYLLEESTAGKILLTIDVYQQKNIVKQGLFQLFGKKKTEGALRRSLVNLETLVKEIGPTGEA